MQDRPSSDELAAGLRRVLAEVLGPRAGDLDPGDGAAVAAALRAALPELAPDRRFRARVAAHVALLLDREASAGDGPVAAEGRRLAALLGAEPPKGADAGAARALQATLAADLRAGRLDHRLDGIAEALREGLAERLAVAHPGWTEVADDGRD